MSHYQRFYNFAHRLNVHIKCIHFSTKMGYLNNTSNKFNILKTRGNNASHSHLKKHTNKISKMLNRFTDSGNEHIVKSKCSLSSKQMVLPQLL